MKLYLTLRFWLIMGRLSLIARRFTTWERLHSPLMLVTMGGTGTDASNIMFRDPTLKFNSQLERADWYAHHYGYGWQEKMEDDDLWGNML